MEVFVDEMPKCCVDCPCNENYCCNLLNIGEIGCDIYTERHKDCPLQQLPTDTKWQKLKEFVKTYQDSEGWKNHLIDEFQEDILDKMQELEE